MPAIIIKKRNLTPKQFILPVILTDTPNITIYHLYHSENYIFKGLFLDYSPRLRKIQLLAIVLVTFLAKLWFC